VPEKLSGPLKQFLGFVGGISATLTTLITATGFLAVRAHLVMLGLSSATFDLQQYLEVGARFLAYLPIFLGIAFLSLGLETLVRGIDFLVEHPFVSAGLFAAWAGGYLLRRRARSRSADAPSRLDAGVAALRKRGAALFRNIWQHPGWLATFLVVQFLGAYQLTQALEVHNLLFAAPGSVSEIPHTALSLVGTDTLTRWIRDGETIRASQYLGWLFLITMLTAWWLHRVLTGYRARAPEEPRPWQLVWPAAGMMLLITQVTLLPVNYGILLSSNQFPEVSLTYGELPLEARPADTRLALLRETGDTYFVYAPSERKIWSLSRSDVRTLRYHGMIPVLRRVPETPPPANDPGCYGKGRPSK